MPVENELLQQDLVSVQKIGFFVEGKTERRLVALLLKDAIEKGMLKVTQQECKGGGKLSGKPVTYTTISISSSDGIPKYSATILDCAGEDNVLPRLFENASKFQKIIAIRDVRPKYSRSEILKLRKLLKTPLKTIQTPVVIVLPIMEVEAWFLAEHTHFSRLDPNLTTNKILESYGYNPETDNMDERETPADDLDNCYKLVGRRYKKGRDTTVNSLDVENIRTKLYTNIPEVRRLLNAIDSFLV